MNNNTKIRLRLSKNLFESLTREILAEAKKGDMSGGAYTEAVKMPKAGKMDEKMSSKEKMAKGLYNEVGAEEETHGMKKEAPGAPPMPSVPGKSAVDKLNLAGTNMEIKDAKTFAKAILDIAQKLQSKEGFKPESNPNIKRAMDALRTLSSGAPAMPQVPTNKSDNSAFKAPAMPGLKEKMSSKEKMAKGLYNEDEMGSSDKYPVGTVLFKPKGNQTITVKRIEGDKIFVVSDLTPNREFQWSTNIIDDGIRTKEFQLKSSGQNEMETMTAEDSNVSEVKSADKIKMNDIYFFTQSTDKYGQSGKAAPIKVRVLSAYNDEWFNVEVQEANSDHKRGDKIKASYVNLFPLTTHFSGSNEPIDEVRSSKRGDRLQEVKGKRKK